MLFATFASVRHAHSRFSRGHAPRHTRWLSWREGYGEAVARQLFVFLQLEFPWVLGPSDGRYLLRDGPEAEPERVVVLETLDAERIAPEISGPAGWMMRRGRGVREHDVEPEPPPAAVRTTRVTVVDPVSLSAEGQARAWLEELDRERDVGAAVAIVNRVVHAHRIAAADPYVREVSPGQALVIRAGWGEGEQVASGMWLHATGALPAPRAPGPPPGTLVGAAPAGAFGGAARGAQRRPAL